MHIPKTRNVDLPTLIMENLSLKNPLIMPPRIAPTPMKMRKIPT